MSRRSLKCRVGKPSAAGNRLSGRFCRLAVETLEDRALLDSAALVVGRVLSTPPSSNPLAPPGPSYFIGEVQNNQVTITYTVYNEQADPETGVLLTTALGAGVTVAGASPVPDAAGKNLAWGLGTIPGYGRASVAVTVNLAGPGTTQLDAGAHAFATLDGAAVSNSAPAAALRAGDVAPGLLASTPDANTGDPYVQEEAARLSYDPQKIFDFVHTQVGYNSYVGSVRGARGTLWSGAGNSLDVASLGVALMRASGVPAQYAQGSLTGALAQQLILSMFPANDRTVGVVPPGTQTSDPGNDPQLLSETEAHSWFQFDAGAGLRDADPLVPGATVGTAFATPGGTFTEVPDAQREKTEVKLRAEVYSAAGAAFGSALTTTTVLDQTFNDVDLVGHPLSVGNFISFADNSGLIAAFSTVTYTPYLDIGDEADPSHDTIVQGTPYQEVLTNFPLASQILTGLFLDVNLTGPVGPPASYERTLVDRIGYAARQSGSGVTVSVDASAGPAVSDSDIQTINVLPGLQSPAASLPLLDRAAQESAGVAATVGQDPKSSSAVAAVRTSIITAEQSQLVQFAIRSQGEARNLATGSDVAAYFDRPSVTIAGTHFDPATGGLDFSFDLRRETLRVIAAPGQNPDAVVAFNFTKGLIDNVFEDDVIPAAGTTVLGTFDILTQAFAQQVPFATVTQDNLPTLSLFDLPADVKARITAAVLAGEVVVTPVRGVTVGTTTAYTWLEINPATGEVSGVLPDGTRSALAEDGATESANAPARATLAQRAAQTTRVWLSKLKPLLDQIRNLPKNAAAKIKLANALQAFAEQAVIMSEVGGILKGAAAVGAALVRGLAGAGDPPLPDILVGLNVPSPDVPPNPASGTLQAAANAPAGSVSGTDRASGVAVTGPLSASWSSNATGGLRVASVSAAGATVVDSGGKTVGTGAVALSAATTTPVAVSGAVQYAVSGQGSLSFYGPAGSSLGVSGNWDNYSATVTGTVTLTLTTDGLSLNGQILPAGTYTVTTSSATLTGRGPSTSPDFAGSASVNATGGTVNLGPGAGTVSVGGKALDPTNVATLTGYTGNLAVTANGDNTDSVTFGGTAGNVLQVSVNPAALTTDENTPVTFKAGVSTSLADSYTLDVRAPSGWTVALDVSGNVTVTPASGLQGGTYPVRVVARSVTNADLVAQGVVNVTVTPTKPGVALSIAPDAVYTVPFNGAEVPSAFRASVHDTGPTADTFNLTFPNPPAGFSVVGSVPAITVPAGQTGFVGVALQPNGPLPPPGTAVPFTVTVTSASNPAVTQTQTQTFTVPAVDAVTATLSPATLTSSPGVPVTATLRLTNAGNVAETVTPGVTAAAGLTAGTLAPVTIQPGQSANVTLTLTPAATAALNGSLAATVKATYGPASAPLTATLPTVVKVRSSQVAAVQQAADAANGIGGGQAGTELSSLADALAQLQAAPTSGSLLARVRFLLGNLATLVQADPALASFTPRLQAVQNAAGAGDVTGLFALVPPFFGDLAGVLTQEADQQFDVSLSPSGVDLAPGEGKTFSLQLTARGNDPVAVTLGVGALPSGVSAVPGQTQVTLTPGQPVTVPVTLTQTLQSTRVFTLALNAAVPLVRHSATAVVAVRPAAADVLGVTLSPAAVNAGTPVGVTARVFNTANASRDLRAHVDVLDASGATIGSTADTPVTLAPGAGAGALSVNLPPVATTGLAAGQYSVRVSLRASDGSPLPGRPAQAPFLVGVPVTATVTSSPALVPPGSSVVTTTVSVANAAAVSPVGATPFGDIQVFYNSAQNFGLGVLDGPVFVIENTSAFDITNGVLSVNPVGGPADAYFVGTVPAGGRAFVEPGLQNDLGNHTFFNPTGTILDTSDLGPNGDDTQFEFTGTAGPSPVDTGVFTPAATRGPSNDNPNVITNFLGQNDQNSNDVFGPKVVATLFASGAGQNGTATELYYTQFSSAAVRKVSVGYNGKQLILGTPVTVASNVPSDGLLIAPNGDIVSANGSVAEINPITGGVTTVGGGSGGEHVALDPDGTKIWTSPQPGMLEEVPINPLGAPVVHPLTGDDTIVTQLAFDAAGNAYYVNGAPNSPGNFGVIDLKTFTTRRVFSNLPGAHGISFDPFTNDLFLVNSNRITQIDPRTLQIVSDYTSPNTGLALDQGANDGKGRIFVGDNGGRLLMVDYSATGLVGDPKNFVASPFLDPSLDDVAPLSGLGSLGVSIEVRHGLPASGFTVDPSTVSPTPASSTATLIDWSGQLPQNGTAPSLFRLSGTVADMAPGEVRAVSAGTRVITTTTAGGQQLSTTIPLAPVVVAAEHVIGLDPPSRTADLGTTAVYNVTLTDPLSTPLTYTLSTDGLAGFSPALAPSVTVNPGQTVNTPLTVTVPANEPAGAYGFTVSAATLQGATDSVEGRLTVSPLVPLATRAVALAISPAEAKAGSGTPATYVLTVTNAGDVTDTFGLVLSGAFAPGYHASFSATGAGFTPASGGSDAALTVPPGEGNARQMTLTIIPPPGAPAGNVPFTVSATSTSAPSVASSAAGSVDVLPNGVGVSLSPPSNAPGGAFAVTVTNTGKVTDTYDLALGGPAGLAASLATSQVTLAPGASRSVAITTNAVPFAVPGALNLTAAATSRGNPAVKGAATSDLMVPTTVGLTSEISPASQTLPAPGPATASVTIHNTGNADDAYQAVIAGTKGPVTASLVGLDGLPTRAIPVFRLPGLSAGTIPLQANFSAPGTGTVVVQVKSLSTGAFFNLVATVTSGIAVVIPTTTTVLNMSPPPTVGLVALAADIAVTSGGLPQSGVVDFVDRTTGEDLGVSTVSAGRATLITPALTAGRHVIVANFGPAEGYAASSGVLTLNVLKDSTKTRLSASPAVAAVGRPVTLTAAVVPDPVVLFRAVRAGVQSHQVSSTPPALVGTVTFRDGNAILATVGVGEGGLATLTTASLFPGPHAITATFSGDPNYLVSRSNAVTVTVNGTGADGPRVVAVRRYGYHWMPTTLAVSFNAPLDPASARNPANYRIAGPGGSIAVISAAYDPATHTVTLQPLSRLDLHKRYVLTVVGTGAGGVRGVQGNLLDGANTGRAGSNYVTFVDASNLVITNPFAPGAAAALQFAAQVRAAHR